MIDVFILFIMLCVECYVAHSSVSHYIYADIEGEDIVLYFFEKFFPISWIMRSKSSDTGEYVARLKPNAKKLTEGKQEAYRRIVIGKECEYRTKASAKGLTLNRGQFLEFAVHTYYEQQYRLDNVPFWTGGDIIIDGVGYQIKSYQARLISESQLEKFGYESPIHGKE